MDVLVSSHPFGSDSLNGILGLDISYQVSSMTTKPFIWLIALLIIIAGFTAVGPPEKSLGVNVRVVYLHGAWVWTSLIAFIAAGAVGLMGFVLRRPGLHTWSQAIGRTALLFWLTFLPLSMWAMQTNWNGLFLAEPRWRMGLSFAIAGILLQVGLTFLDRPSWTSIGNILFVSTMFFTLSGTENVMHPPAPIRDSQVVMIQLYYTALLALTLAAAWQVARLWHRSDQIRVRER